MQDIIILCVGSDKVIGDSLGPVVGDMLINDLNIGAVVYGRTGANVNSVNIARYDKFIKRYHKNAFIIAVDACLGQQNDIGKIKMKNDGVAAGLAVGRTDIRVGNLGFVGVVGAISSDNMDALRRVDCDIIVKLAATIATKISSLLKKD